MMLQLHIYVITATFFTSILVSSIMDLLRLPYVEI